MSWEDYPVPIAPKLPDNGNSISQGRPSVISQQNGWKYEYGPGARGWYQSSYIDNPVVLKFRKYQTHPNQKNKIKHPLQSKCIYYYFVGFSFLLSLGTSFFAFLYYHCTDREENFHQNKSKEIIESIEIDYKNMNNFETGIWHSNRVFLFFRSFFLLSEFFFFLEEGGGGQKSSKNLNLGSLKNFFIFF